MCGIAGILTNGDPSIAADRVRAMSDRLAHRGPDDSGMQVLTYHSPELTVALGHRRLSIIDLSPAGRQPMQPPDGEDVWIVFNGEIYNFRELRAELERCGRRFRTGTDTEVILAAYEEWGAACVERLEGMFALALWDGRSRELLLARDRLGKKPLLYFQDGSTFAFASELHALTRLPEVAHEFDAQALAAYFLLGFVPGERCILSQVRKLPPGHRAVWRDGRLTLSRYWDVLDCVSRDGRSPANEAEALEELDALLAQSVRQRLISDVPLGAWLSGGIDSSLVVAGMCAARTGPVRTFTIGFDDAALDESAAARAVAAHLGTTHEEFRVSGREMLAAVPEAAAVYDEPFSDTAGIPTYLLSKLSRRHVTVALCGDGGDEDFMGYRHYLRGRAMHALQRIPSPLRRGLAAAAAPFGGAQWRQRMRSVGYRDWADLYVAITASLRHETTGAVVPDPFGLEDTEYRRTVTALEGCEAETVLRALDLLTTLPDKFLVKVDRAAMHVGLEVRAPFLDRRLVEWALRLPRQWLVRGRTTKALLRELLYRKVPRELVDRPKQGFCPPIGRWLRNELSDWVRDTLAPCRVRDVGPLDERAVTRIVELHASGGIDLGPAVWTLVCFMQWHHRLKSAGTEAVARV